MLAKKSIQQLLGFESLERSLTIYISGKETIQSTDDTPITMRFFNAEEIDRVKSLIRTYDIAKGEGKNARSGGGAISTSLALIETARESLLMHIGKINNILYPQEKTRTTLEDKAAQVLRERFLSNKANNAKMPTALLRTMAEIQLGDDKHLDFTNQQLAGLLAWHSTYDAVPGDDNSELE
jgi:hypothetical protein